MKELDLKKMNDWYTKLFEATHHVAGLIGLEYRKGPRILIQSAMEV